VSEWSFYFFKGYDNVWSLSPFDTKTNEDGLWYSKLVGPTIVACPLVFYPFFCTTKPLTAEGRCGMVHEDA